MTKLPHFLIEVQVDGAWRPAYCTPTRCPEIIGMFQATDRESLMSLWSRHGNQHLIDLLSKSDHRLREITKKEAKALVNQWGDDWNCFK